MTQPIPVRGQQPVTVDEEKLLDDAYQSNMITASRREVAAARRRGMTLSEAEAREVVMEKYKRGEDVMPQFRAISQRISRGRGIPR